MSRTRRRMTPNYIPDWDTPKDKKKWFKPTKEFKKIRKAIRKAKERAAVRNAVAEKTEAIPEFPKTDMWEFN